METMIHCWGGYKLVQQLWKTSQQRVLKLSICKPYDPEVPPLVIHSTKMYARGHQKSHRRKFFAA